jgi:hypothetical protein
MLAGVVVSHAELLLLATSFKVGICKKKKKKKKPFWYLRFMTWQSANGVQPASTILISADPIYSKI